MVYLKIYKTTYGKGEIMTIGEVYRDKYKVLQVLKDSPEICVVLAEHIQLNSYWIIKKIGKSNGACYREIDMLKNIRHQGIPIIIDVFDEGDFVVLIREYIQGETLNEYLEEYLTNNPNEKGLTELQVISIGIKLCKIIKFLHEELDKPLIYRDLKPGNIIITDSKAIKLIDFGIARYHNPNKNRDTEYLGTKGFASPEQFGFSQSDVRTDVFGIGATLYNLLSNLDLGKPPYRQVPFSKIRQDVSVELESILLKACYINMEKRYQTVDDMLRALEALINIHKEVMIYKELKSFENHMLVIKGITKGAGATYSTLAMAKQLILMGYKPLVIGMTNKFETLEFQMSSLIKNHILYYENIPILLLNNWSKMNYQLGESINDYNILIVDAENELTDTITNSDVIDINVVSVSPWSIDIFEEHVLTPKGREDVYFINNCSKNLFNEIKDSLEAVTMFHIPHIPFEDIDKNNGVFVDILMKMGVELLCTRRKSFWEQVKSKIGLANLTKQ